MVGTSGARPGLPPDAGRRTPDAVLFDTIAAIATPLGIGGVGIVRISGPEALSIGGRLFRKRHRDGTPGSALDLDKLPSHTVHYGYFVEPESDRVIDEVLLLVMRAPRTFTAEEVVEIHGHGGPLVLQSILQSCFQAGARLARPGEFTQRAFLNGRLDLAQAEAVLDLIRSKTGGSLRAANEQLMGRLSQPIQAMRERLVWLLARLEASIDYPDEIDDLPQAEITRLIDEARTEVQRLLDTAAAGRIWREGIPMAIVGRPNVGKSSLLNALLREDRAIVTDIPGTTRDVLEEYLNVRGIPLKVMDTAGLRATEDAVERIGVERTRRSLAGAELALLVMDALCPLGDEDCRLLPELQGCDCILVLNKMDLLPPGAQVSLPEPLQNLPCARLSALTGAGLADLEEAIAATVWSKSSAGAASPVAINARHQESLWRARESLNKAAESVQEGLPGDFIAIDLQTAVVSLGEITGETVTEEVIEAIFANFCVGK